MKLLGFRPPSDKAGGEDATQEPAIDDATRRRVFAETIRGVIDDAAPVIDASTRQRVIEEANRGEIADTPRALVSADAGKLPSAEAIRNHVRRYRDSRSKRSK